MEGEKREEFERVMFIQFLPLSLCLGPMMPLQLKLKVFRSLPTCSEGARRPYLVRPELRIAAVLVLVQNH